MKKSGFTLVEIAVVTIIVGLLVTMGSMAITKSVQNSRIKNAEAELEMISAAILQLAWDTGRWPNGQLRTEAASGANEKWDLSGDECGLLGTDGTYDNWKGPYYGGPTADPWGNNYFFDSDYYPMGDHSKECVVVGSYGRKAQSQYDADDLWVRVDD